MPLSLNPVLRFSPRSRTFTTLFVPLWGNLIIALGCAMLVPVALAADIPAAPTGEALLQTQARSQPISQPQLEVPQSAGDASIDPLENMTLDDALQQLKKDVLALNRDLFILKEELLFPAHTQVAVFLSLDVGEFFELDAVTISFNDKPVASHLYTPNQTNALMRGGVQRLYLGNVKNGEHEITAVFTGRGPQGRDYRRASTLTFAKADEAKHLEVKIIDSTKLLQPEFSIREWN